MDLFEMQAGIVVVLFPNLVGLPGLFLDFIWQFIKSFSELIGEQISITSPFELFFLIYVPVKLRQQAY